MSFGQRLQCILWLFLLIGCEPAYSMDHIWQKIGLGITDLQIRCLAVATDDQTIYAGTARGIYKSTNQGKDFLAVFQTPGHDQGVNFLYIDPPQPDNIYAATDAGLFVSTDSGSHWQGIFNPKDSRDRQCLSVMVDENTIYLGTLDGLFIKEINKSVWQKRKELSSNGPLTFITHDSQYLYFSSPDELFRVNKNDHTYEKVFVMTSRKLTELGVAATPEDSSDEMVLFSKQIKFMAQPLGKDTPLYLATTKGVFFSDSHGDHWQTLTVDSLPYEDITSLLVIHPGQIFLGTTQGLFQYQQGRWHQLYQGLETNEVNYLAAGKDGHVYLAADRGIFFMLEKKNFAKDLTMSYGDIEQKFTNEPTIAQTQAMAIDYAEVHPDKIKQWRQRANRKALLPTLSVGLDRSASEFYHWDTGVNPDVLVKGKDYLDWDVSLSWNLGDLVWNNDQTSIDSRSKLMVELREDVLDQVTRLYFERRRLQVELMGVAEEFAGAPGDKQMRLFELTALIDALTGGEFSRRLRKQ